MSITASLYSLYSVPRARGLMPVPARTLYSVDELDIVNCEGIGVVDLFGCCSVELRAHNLFNTIMLCAANMDSSDLAMPNLYWYKQFG